MYMIFLPVGNLIECVASRAGSTLIAEIFAPIRV